MDSEEEPSQPAVIENDDSVQPQDSLLTEDMVPPDTGDLTQDTISRNGEEQAGDAEPEVEDPSEVEVAGDEVHQADDQEVNGEDGIPPNEEEVIMDEEQPIPVGIEHTRELEAIDDSADIEQLIEEENQIMAQEELEQAMKMTDEDENEEEEPPEVKEFIEAEQPEPEMDLTENPDEESFKEESESNDMDLKVEAESMGEPENVGDPATSHPTSHPTDKPRKKSVPQNLYEVFYPKDQLQLGTGKPEKKTFARRRSRKSYPFIARHSKQMEIIRATQIPAPKHDYFGHLFSADSKRPPPYYHNYFLPQQRQPLHRQHVKIIGKIIPEEVVKPFLNSPLHSMPLSTIKVRWSLHRNSTMYKAEDLYAYLTRFGAIERVYQLTNNSAIVVFAELEAAFKAVKQRGLGLPWDALIADWMDPRMNNVGYCMKYTHEEKSIV